MHAVFVFGTRPEGIKCLPVVRALEERGVRVSIVNTRQHTEMLDSVFSTFGRSPDVTLSDLHKERSMCELLAHMLNELPIHLRAIAPDIILVQGDTLSAYAGALCAFLSEIPVGHIEAGLRTGNVHAPYPEEALRRSITPFAAFHFAPTREALDYLMREGAEGEIALVGNPVADALRHLCPPRAQNPGTVLVTVHRRESGGEGHRKILWAVRTLAERHPELRFVCPVHKSEQVRAAYAVLENVAGVTLTEPLPPDALYRHLAEARLVLTDSGGLTEESALLGIPTVILRDTTEREQELKLSYIRLGTTIPDCILAAAEQLLNTPMPTIPDHSFHSPATRIAEILCEKMQ